MAIEADSHASKEPLEVWREAYNDEINGIEVTLTKLLNDHLAFSCFVKLLEDEVERTDGEPQLNSTLMQMLRDGYFATAILGIGRLIEKQSTKLYEEVYSIRAVLESIEAHQSLITRAFFREKIWAGQFPNWCENQFDYLSTKNKLRSDTDLMDVTVLIALKTRIENASNIYMKKFRDKYIAHSATIKSRSDYEQLAIGLTEIRSTLAELKLVSDSIALNFIGVSPLSTTPCPDWDYLDRPISTAENIPSLRKHWQEISGQLFQQISNADHSDNDHKS